jgi:hypothetical protein
MRKVTLSAVGLSPQEGTVVNVVANLLAALDHAVKVLDAGDISGDIVLISHASDAGRAALGALGKGQRAVLFVDSENEVKGYPALTRPVRVQTLRDLLVDLVPRIPVQTTQAAAQAQPATPAASSDAVAPAAAHPSNLFYLLLDSVVQRTLLRIDSGADDVVLVHGPSQCIYTKSAGTSLDQMAKQAPDGLRPQILAESDFMRATKGMPLTRLHDLIWLAERHGSRGTLLQGHSVDMPVRLKVWPKFNSRHVRPDYLKLAALLSKQPLTLRMLAESSGVPLANVIDFYNASVAFGVIEKMETAHVVTPPPKPSANGGLLGKIAKRLALKRD